MQVKPGQVFSTYVNWQGVVGTWSWAGFGFGAGRKGTYAIAMAANVGTFEMYRMDNYGSGVTLAKAAQTWVPDRWYRMEVQWLSTTGDNIVARLYEINIVGGGETLLNTISARDTTYTSGGIGFRAFGDPWYFDTVLRGATAPLVSGLSGATAFVAAWPVDAGIARSGSLAGNGMPSVVQPDYVAPATALVPPPAGTRASVTDEIFSAWDHTLPTKHRYEWELELVDLDFLPER